MQFRIVPNMATLAQSAKISVCVVGRIVVIVRDSEDTNAVRVFLPFVRVVTQFPRLTIGACILHFVKVEVPADTFPLAPTIPPINSVLRQLAFLALIARPFQNAGAYLFPVRRIVFIVAGHIKILYL